MTTYSRQISEASLAVLRELVGRFVYHVYSPCLQIHQRHLTSPSISIPISDEVAAQWIHRYVTVRCEWFETPQESIDYWQLIVGNEQNPRGIEVSPALGIIAPCTIEFYGHTSPIQKIEVHTFSWPPPERLDAEAVEYDSAIHFQRADGSSFCISCQLDGPGIATEVHFSDHEETIAGLLRDTKLRLCIV